MEWLGNNSRAIAILRVSSYNQKDNTSHATQEAYARSYCAEMSLELSRVVPIVETASKSELRKKYQENLQWALSNGVRHIVFLVYDREARNLTDNERNETLVRQDRIVLHYAQDRKVLHKGSPDSDFYMRDINAATNKHYSRLLSTKVRGGTKTKAESGWFPSTHLTDGYVHQKLKDDSGREFRRRSIIVPDPNEQVCRRVRREYELRAAEKLSVYEIRKRIISEGLVAPGERSKYHTSGIDRRLKNKFYNGRFEWQGEEYQGKHAKFIPDELFWAVQETFGVRNPLAKKGSGVFGGGWLKCGIAGCGCHVVYDPKKKLIKETGAVKVYKFYHCTNGKKVHPTMKGLSVTEESLFEQFGGAVDRITINEDFAKQIADALNETERKAHRAIDREVAGYKDALAALEGREDRAYEDFVAHVLDRDGYQRQIKKVRADRAHFTELLRSANQAISSAGMETAKTILELATQAKTLWKMRGAAERKEFLDRLLSNQVLDGPSVRYEMKKPFEVLAGMAGNSGWRREWDSNPRYF